jgi:bifunctional pyridoxal-dependent enzyme with beta-cystathionase and maltose regulon repressor activities
VSISSIKATPANYLGQVFAEDEAEAIKEAAKEFNVAEAFRDRIVARREDY